MYVQPVTYIRFSETVEECTGCQYDLNTEDDHFLQSFNRTKGPGPKCTEDNFEQMMEFFEAKQKASAPAGWVDGTVLAFDLMKAAVAQAITTKRLDAKVAPFVTDVYDHWKRRRIASGNQPLQPLAKEETDQKKDESDPYVCFRYRDARQKRTTRQQHARDIGNNTKKIRDLRNELEMARMLIHHAHEREMLKLKALKWDREIFETRAEVKKQKVRLGIKTDDEDLINQKVCMIHANSFAPLTGQQPQKRKAGDSNQMQRQPGQHVRMPGRSDGRLVDADLILLSDLQERKENLVRAELEEKARQHREWNSKHIDLTRGPLSPIQSQGFETGFRHAMAQYQVATPPASVRSGSESFDHPSPAEEESEPVRKRMRYGTPPEDDEPRRHQSYRRRIGRGGRLWVDRRGMAPLMKEMDPAVSDRWKYDSDDDSEQPVYEIDPYNTNALRFRATIPLPAHTARREEKGEKGTQQARPNGSSPANRPAIAAAQQASSQVLPQART